MNERKRLLLLFRLVNGVDYCWFIADKEYGYDNWLYCGGI